MDTHYVTYRSVNFHGEKLVRIKFCATTLKYGIIIDCYTIINILL